MAANESDTVGERESDSQKIDRIAAFVQEQRKEGQSWTASLDKFTIYLAVAAFFFGVGTFADLRRRFDPPPPNSAQLAKDGYVKTLDDYCKSFIGTPPGGGTGTGYAKIAADDLAVLNARHRMNGVWNYYGFPANMAARDRSGYLSIKSYYFAANDLLQAAVGRARAGDGEGYARDVGLYRAANGAFLKAAVDFGFTVCDHYWPVDDAPAP
jgi:hypothetical protein